MAAQQKDVILVVEDTSVIRIWITASLETEGFSVVAAPNGADALDILNVARPDLIITDLEMPVMDGLRLVRAVRRRPMHIALPILVLSSRRGEDNAAQAFREGASMFLRKPITHSDLIHAVRGLLAVNSTAAADPAALEA